VGLHIAIVASMRIHFHQSCFVVLLIWGASPFAPKFRETISRFQLWWRIRFVKKRKRIVCFVSGSVQTVIPSAPIAQLLRYRFAQAWAPFLVCIYVVVSYSRLDWKREKFDQELFPFSPMALFWRINTSKRNVRHLERIQETLSREGAYPDRNK